MWGKEMSVLNGNAKARSWAVRSVKLSRSFAIVVAAASLFPLTGCGTVGTLVSKTEQFEVTDSVVLRAKPRDFVAAVEAVGQSLGYKVSGLDRASNKVTLSTSSSLATGVLIGKVKNFSMTATLGADGRTVAITAYSIGNFKTADRENVEKRIADFKTALVSQAGR